MVRYRSEIPFGEGYRDIVPVLVHETVSLGNDDVLIYLYKYHLEGELKYDCFELLNRFWQEELAEDIFYKFYEKALDFLKKKTGKNLKYCLWLANKETVIDYYGQGELSEDDIDAYECSDVILTDLGYDGALYAYEELPNPIEKEEKE